METTKECQVNKIYEDKINPDEVMEYANRFGEGSPALTELIKYCILNNIHTLACCKGHPDEMMFIDRISEKGYITFRFDDDYDENFACCLATIPLFKKGVTASVENSIDIGRTISLYVPATAKNMSEEYFNFILNLIRDYQELIEADIPISPKKEIRSIINYEFKSVNNEQFVITNKGIQKYLLEYTKTDNVVKKKSIGRRIR